MGRAAGSLGVVRRLAEVLQPVARRGGRWGVLSRKLAAPRRRTPCQCCLLAKLRPRNRLEIEARSPTACCNRLIYHGAKLGPLAPSHKPFAVEAGARPNPLAPGGAYTSPAARLWLAGANPAL